MLKSPTSFELVAAHVAHLGDAVLVGHAQVEDVGAGGRAVWVLAVEDDRRHGDGGLLLLRTAHTATNNRRSSAADATAAAQLLRMR